MHNFSAKTPKFFPTPVRRHSFVRPYIEAPPKTKQIPCYGPDGSMLFRASNAVLRVWSNYSNSIIMLCVIYIFPVF